MLLLGADNEFVEVGDDTNGGSPGGQFRVLFLAEFPGGTGMSPVVGPVVSEEFEDDAPFGGTRTPGKGKAVEPVHALHIALKCGVSMNAPGQCPGGFMENLVLQGGQCHERSIGDIAPSDRGV